MPPLQYAVNGRFVGDAYASRGTLRQPETSPERSRPLPTEHP